MWGDEVQPAVHRGAMRSVFVMIAILGAALNGCGGEEDDTPPPPTAAVGSVTGPTGQTLVTVVANSNPPGANVTGGGRPLGVTPLTTRVPVPAPAPGEVQSFSFRFELAGHQTATIDASPVNGTISITAALAPDREPEQAEDEADAPDELGIVGRGGGPIYDDHVTRGSADVDADCTIDRLRVRLAGTHTYYADLHITLRDPDGNRYSLHRGARSNPFRGHVVRRAEGRQARGRWTLAVHDRLAQDGGHLRGWSMSLRCR